MRTGVVLLLLFVLAIAIGQGAPAAASAPAFAAGTLNYVPALAGEPQLIGGVTFYPATEDATWAGTFEGASIDECVVAVFKSGMNLYRAEAYFDGSVDGRAGEVTLHLTGVKMDEQSEWDGHWKVVQGTGALAGLRGQGTFSGAGSPGFGEAGMIHYEGETEFGS